MLYNLNIWINIQNEHLLLQKSECRIGEVVPSPADPKNHRRG